VSATISQFAVAFGGVPAGSTTQASTFTYPAREASNFSWAAGPSGGANSSAGIVQLRVSPTMLVCVWMQVTGSGSGRTLAVVVLGGAGQN
jgi:hypothetical protein